MKHHLDKFLQTFSLDSPSAQALGKLVQMDGVSEDSIVADSTYLNSTILNSLKGNLHAVKALYLYEYLYNAYSKVAKTQAYFSYQNLFKDEDTEEESQSRNSSPWLNMEIFLLCISHLTSLISAKMNSLESKQIAAAILKVLSVLAEENEIKTICRRQKFIGNFIKLFSDSIVNSPAPDQLTPDVNIAILSAHVLAKLTFKCKKNQDYLLQKKVQDLFKVALISGDKSPLIFTAAAGIISNLANSSDSRLLLWTSGVMSIGKKVLTSSIDSNVQLFSYYMVSKLLQECKEVVDEIKNDSVFVDSIGQILASQDFQDMYIQKPESLATFSVCLGVIRRIAGFPDIRLQMMKKFYKYPVNFIQKNKQINPSSPNAQIHSLAIKESIALIGVFAIEEESRVTLQRSVQKLPSLILSVALNQLQDSKLIKVSLGCLTNLSASEQCRDELSVQSDFNTLIHQSIDKYDYTPSVLEYVLKMILNNSQNSISFKNFSTPKTILKILFIAFAYQQHVLVVDLTSKILKTLCSNQLVLLSIVRCIREYELSNQQYKFSKVIVNSLKTLQQSSVTEGVLDTILLLACISAVDNSITQELQETDFLIVVKDILETKRSNPTELYKVTSTLSYLPLEDLKGFSQL